MRKYVMAGLADLQLASCSIPFTNSYEKRMLKEMDRVLDRWELYGNGIKLKELRVDGARVFEIYQDSEKNTVVVGYRLDDRNTVLLKILFNENKNGGIDAGEPVMRMISYDDLLTDVEKIDMNFQGDERDPIEINRPENGQPERFRLADELWLKIMEQRQVGIKGDGELPEPDSANDI